MVATSQPLATESAVATLRRGGNAVDAALTAAAVLCVVEPMMTGIGGDLFALVSRPGEAPVGIDAAGPAPAAADTEGPIAEHGPESVSVPGAVAGWAALADRFGTTPFDRILEPAIEAARAGYAVQPITADWWQAHNPAGFPEPPTAGARWTDGALARTLEQLADHGPAALYQGPLAEHIVASSWLAADDLATYEAAWVEPLAGRYRDHTIYELPPPTQGVVALEALALLERTDPSLHEQVRCVALALEDGAAAVRDGADVRHLLDAAYVSARAADLPRPIAEPAGGTVYVAAADRDGVCVSLIQSIFHPFGSRVIAGNTGIVLQNRVAGFAIEGRVVPGRRPYHTIIPALLSDEGGAYGAFGVVGGSIQAQAHVQLVSALVDAGLDPQAALESPRFRIEGGAILLEEALWPRAPELEGLGLTPRLESDYKLFGGGQVILRDESGYVGGSDPRKDGYAAGV